MDLSGLLGLLLALLAVVGAVQLDGGELGQLANLPAAVIVVGGTLAAAAVQTPSAEFRYAIRLMLGLFRSSLPDCRSGLSQLVGWCELARRHGLLALEQQADQLDDDFTRVGLRLLVDGGTVDSLRATLEIEMVTREQRDLQGARVIESMGGYAPTLGIIGAVLGLIQVLGNLSAPEQLGSGIATAFVATVYGVGLANLLLIPLANRIKAYVQARYQYQEMVLEGLMLIADGHTPQALQRRLMGYLQ
ncbi:flagellar motor protein [Marinobacterium arenosum]|uniref:flagellar motor protein n=1 Tax=Marinobacterium arenosum TaxID=2862496 RepID=UPI001C975CD1|nr:flagellar motor protein [Marinobacterium arenosum]MBY4675967.1 flagellar motor protein [Marinobacterium arenosum]